MKSLKVTPEEEEKIKSSYEKTESEIEKDISAIKEWLKKQPHLPQDEDDLRIKRVFLLNKCSMEKTKSKLDSYYSLKHFVPEIYENREPKHPSVIALMDNMQFLPLPRLTPECHRVYITRYANNDASKFDINVYFKLLFGVFDVQQMYDVSLGDQIISDMEHSTFKHMIQLTPANMKKAFTLLAKSYSDRIKGLHFINVPPSSSAIVNICTSILSKKIANRVFLHATLDSLHKHIPKEILPLEFGGTFGTLNDLYDEWKQDLWCKNDWIKEIGEKRSDESKRIGEPLDSELFGMSGSFRKLDID